MIRAAAGLCAAFIVSYAFAQTPAQQQLREIYKELDRLSARLENHE